MLVGVAELDERFEFLGRDAGILNDDLPVVAELGAEGLILGHEVVELLAHCLLLGFLLRGETLAAQRPPALRPRPLRASRAIGH